MFLMFYDTNFMENRGWLRRFLPFAAPMPAQNDILIKIGLSQYSLFANNFLRKTFSKFSVIENFYLNKILNLSWEDKM